MPADADAPRPSDDTAPRQRQLFGSDEADSQPQRRRTRDLARNVKVHLRISDEELDDALLPPLARDSRPLLTPVPRETETEADAVDTSQRPTTPTPRRTSVSLDFDCDAPPRPPQAAPQTPGRSRSRLRSAPGSMVVPERSEALTVSEITGALKKQVELGFEDVWVHGEVANLSRTTRQHIFFSLKDEQALLKCVMWAKDAERLRFTLRDGLEVLVRGRVSLYEPQGQVQLYVSRVQPQGQGALQLAFEQLKAQLDAEGLFAPDRKRPLPFLPRRVGLITSRHGAALRDVLKTIRSRYPGMPLLLADTRVQGEGAANEIANAIRLMNRFVQRGGIVDVLLITRGGGSYEDLMVFNDERVARAIAASRIPTISAVGHQIDTTIADFVADCRATTPTDGARRVVPEQQELQRSGRMLGQRLKRAVYNRLTAARTEARHARARLERFAPQARVREIRHRLDVLAERMANVLRRRLAAAHTRLDRAREAALHLDPARALLPRLHERLQRNEQRLHQAAAAVLRVRRQQVAAAAAALEALSPLNVLARGYSVTLDADGRALTDAAGVAVGDEVRTLLHRGEVRSRVVGVERAVNEPEPPA